MVRETLSRQESRTEKPTPFSLISTREARDLVTFLVAVSSGGPRHSADTAFICADSLGSPWRRKGGGDRLAHAGWGAQRGGGWCAPGLGRGSEGRARMSSGGFWGTRSHKTGFSALVWTLRTAHPAWPLGRSPANRIAPDSAQFCAQSAGSGPLLRRMKPVSWRGLLTVASVVGKPLPAVPTRVSDPVCALARGRGRVCGRVGRGGWCGGGVRQCGFLGDGARTRRWLRPPLPRPLRSVGCARSHTRAPPVPGFLLRGPRSQLEATLVWSRTKGMWGPGRPAPLQPSLPPRGAHLELEIIVAGGAFHGEGLGEAEGEQRELRTLEPVLVLCTPGAPIQGPPAPGTPP